MNSQVNYRPLMKKVSSDVLTSQCPTLSLVHTQENIFTQVALPSQATATSLVFAGTDQLLQTALKNNALGFIIPEQLLPAIQGVIDQSKSLWTTKNIQGAMTDVLKLFDGKTSINSQIHPTAFIDPSAQIGQNVTIEPFAVIGKNVVIGHDCVIGAHCVLENESSLGDRTRLSAHVFLGFNCHLGKDCVIGPQTVFGSDGFGFTTNKQGLHQKISQIGQVIVEDNCEFGAHCAVDRATISETRIRQGSKFDNFIHIAHNCDIGENALIAAGFIVAGSTQIGKNLTAAGSVGVLGHLKIADHVVLTGRTGVTSSIDQPGFYGGFPQIDHKENLKVMSSLQSLPRLRKQVNQILKHLGLNDEKK